jgi:hypothetical protein
VLHNPHQQHQGQRQDRPQRQPPEHRGADRHRSEEHVHFLRHDFGNPVPVVFLLFRFMYPPGKKEIDALQVEKEKFMEKAG